MNSLYIESLSIRRRVKFVTAEVETEVTVYLSDQQPNQDPDDVREIVRNVVEGIDKKET